jgi:hypothetical protein
MLSRVEDLASRVHAEIQAYLAPGRSSPMIRPDATLIEAVRERAYASLTMLYCMMLALTLKLDSDEEAQAVATHGRWLKFGRAVVDFLI